VWSFIPDTFEAYARVLHPAHRTEGNSGTVRWSELAERNGVTLGPATSFREVSGLEPDAPGWDAAYPNEGTLEREQVEAIADLLAPFTKTHDRCWLAAWDGWGSWGPGSSTTLFVGTDEVGRRGRIRRRTRRSVDRMTKETWRRLDAIPRVTAEHRAYFLFTARLRDIGSFEVGGWHQAPSIWWPDDRAWCVATEVDGYSTYVGGSAECVEALIASERIEAIAVTPDAPMDPGAY
jgi:hypothetical protein